MALKEQEKLTLNIRTLFFQRESVFELSNIIVVLNKHKFNSDFLQEKLMKSLFFWFLFHTCSNVLLKFNYLGSCSNWDCTCCNQYDVRGRKPKPLLTCSTVGKREK